MNNVSTSNNVGNTILNDMTSNVSGALDIPLLVDSILYGETGIEIAGVESKLEALNSKREAFSLLSQGLDGFKDIMSEFRTAFASGEKVSSIGDSSVAKVTVDSRVSNGSYSVEVLQLALKQSVSVGGFSAAGSLVGEGVFTIQNGSRASGSFVASGGSTTLTIVAGTTAQDLVDQINTSSANVNAYLVKSGAGYDIAISSAQTGDSKGFDITISDADGDSTDSIGLSSFQFNDVDSNMLSTQSASDAIVKFDGVQLTSDTNTFDNMIPGVVINVSKVNLGSPTILTVNDDTEQAEVLLKDFITTYNDMIEVLEYLGGEEEGEDSQGSLFRDSDLKMIEKGIKDTMAGYVSGYGGTPLLNNIGVRFTDDGDGSIELDESAFDAAMLLNPESVAIALGQMGTATDPRVTFLEAGDGTVEGFYSPIDVTVLPENAVLTGSASAGLVIDGTNNSFSMTINGVSSGNLNLTQKVYASNDELALEIQSQLNNAILGNITVSHDGTSFKIDSGVLGAASVITVDTADAGFSSTVGFNNGDTASGVDIVGSIGGNLAIGVGNVLEGILGDSRDVKLQINANVLGQYGDLSISDGVGKSFFDQIEDMFALDGAYTSTFLRIESSISDKDEQLIDLQTKTEILRVRYSIRYSALNSMIIGFDSTATQLQMQFDAWAKG
jgi:flagellar hook-associated protein 2